MNLSHTHTDIPIFRSNLPGLRRAGSRVSGRLVAIMNFTLPSVSNPSIWFNNYTQNGIDFNYPIRFKIQIHLYM